MGADLPNSALETEDHVPKAEHIDPIKSCIIRDDLHESTPLLKGAPPYSCSEVNPTDKSEASPLVTHRERTQKHPVRVLENVHHQGVV